MVVKVVVEVTVFLVATIAFAAAFAPLTGRCPPSSPLVFERRCRALRRATLTNVRLLACSAPGEASGSMASATSNNQQRSPHDRSCNEFACTRTRQMITGLSFGIG